MLTCIMSLSALLTYRVLATQGRVCNSLLVGYMILADSVRVISGTMKGWSTMSITITAFLLIGNLSGLIPYTVAPASLVQVSACGALILMLGILLKAVVTHRSKCVLAFMPQSPLALTPIILLFELIAYISRSVSLGVRIIINLSIGGMLTHTMIVMLGDSLPVFGLIGGFLAFEYMVAYLQAYIFTVIYCMTQKDMLVDK